MWRFVAQHLLQQQKVGKRAGQPIDSAVNDEASRSGGCGRWIIERGGGCEWRKKKKVAKLNMLQHTHTHMHSQHEVEDGDAAGGFGKFEGLKKVVSASHARCVGVRPPGGRRDAGSTDPRDVHTVQ